MFMLQSLKDPSRKFINRRAAKEQGHPVEVMKCENRAIEALISGYEPKYNSQVATKEILWS